MNACSYPRRCCAFLLHECMPYYRKTRNTRAQTSSEMKNSSQSARSLLEFFGVNTHKRHKKSSTHMGTRSGRGGHFRCPLQAVYPDSSSEFLFSNRLNALSVISSLWYMLVSNSSIILMSS